MPDRDSPDQDRTAAALVCYLSRAAHGRARTARALRLHGPGAWRELALMVLGTVLPALGAILLLG